MWFAETVAKKLSEGVPLSPFVLENENREKVFVL